MPVKRKVYETTAEADMTPMIDMTFQLIAFFMVLINFAEDNQDQRINLPQSELAKPPEGAMESPITLQLDKQGRVLFSGEEAVPVAAMHTMLRREVEALDRQGKSAGSATVIIRADGETPTGQVQDLIQVCQELKFEKFALRAKQEAVSQPVK
jgi:biopolymer transport protein ExbD